MAANRQQNVADHPERAGSDSPPRRRSRGTPATRLDRIVHERVRLGILSALAVNPELSFTELRDLLATSDGNLSVHSRKLEEAGYITCNKDFAGRTPRTTYALTEAGRKALSRYLNHMEAIIETIRG